MKKWSHAAIVGLALTIFTPPAAYAQEATALDHAAKPDRTNGLADFVDGAMAELIASGEVAGAVITVVDGEKLLFNRGYGFANISEQEKVDPERTLFRPGSVSKLFTWTALMQQVERGTVDLDADVNDYIDYPIPSFGTRPIRVRDLLQHTPGLSDIDGIMSDGPDSITPYRDWIKLNIPERRWDAGTEISYSNYGVALAGYIVERVSGEPFADYVDRHVFKPLGMTSTTFSEPLPDRMLDRMAIGYTLKDGQYVAQPYEYFSPVMPAGSAASTGPDMARFMLAMLGRGQLGDTRILKPDSVNFLFANSIANAPHLPGMAHGFLVTRNADPRLVGHAGNTIHFHSNLVLATEKGIGFFISMTGGEGSSAGRTSLSNALIGRLFPQQPAARWTQVDSSPPPMGAYRGGRRDYSKPADPKSDLILTMPSPHVVLVKTSDSTTAWEQIGPALYEKTTDAREGGPFDQLEFYGPVDDPKLSFASQPYQSYHLLKPAKVLPD